jgi:hypothetical protein
MTSPTTPLSTTTESAPIPDDTKVTVKVAGFKPVQLPYGVVKKREKLMMALSGFIQGLEDATFSEIEPDDKGALTLTITPEVGRKGATDLVEGLSTLKPYINPAARMLERIEAVKAHDPGLVLLMCAEIDAAIQAAEHEIKDIQALQRVLDSSCAVAVSDVPVGL